MFIYTVALNPKISEEKILKTIRSLIKAEELDKEKKPEEDIEESDREIGSGSGREDQKDQEKTKIHR